MAHGTPRINICYDCNQYTWVPRFSEDPNCPTCGKKSQRTNKDEIIKKYTIGHYPYVWKLGFNHWEVIAENKNILKEAILTEDILLKIGFEKLPHFTIQNALIYKLGRNRHLSIGSVGTPNEMLYICESDSDNYKKITDLVCLHNYDYDGYLSKLTLETLISSIGGTHKHLK